MKYLLLLILFTSCATIHKSKKSIESTSSKVDSSKEESSSAWKQIIKERTTAPYTVNSDSVSSNSYKPAQDTMESEFTSQSNGINVTTKVKPKIQGGKIIGYDINTKAKTNPKTVDIPIDKITKTTQSQNTIKQSGSNQTSHIEVRENDKKAYRFNFAGALALICIIGITLFFIYRYLKIKK